MILLSDAMVLMDLGYVQGIDALAKIASVEVLDVVLNECDHIKQPNLVADIRAAGIKEVVTTNELAETANLYTTTYEHLSFQDSACLHYAKENRRLLLTNEKKLRERCTAESVLVYGTIWVMEQTHAKGIREKSQLCNWITELTKKDRRLPKDEVSRLRTAFGCSN